MRVIVLVADEYTLTSPTHSIGSKVLFETCQACNDRRILFWLSLLSAKGVIAQGVQSDRLWLVFIEVFWKDWTTMSMVFSATYTNFLEELLLTGKRSAKLTR